MNTRRSLSVLLVLVLSMVAGGLALADRAPQPPRPGDWVVDPGFASGEFTVLDEPLGNGVRRQVVLIYRDGRQVGERHTYYVDLDGSGTFNGADHVMMISEY